MDVSRLAGGSRRTYRRIRGRPNADASRPLRACLPAPPWLRADHAPARARDRGPERPRERASVFAPAGSRLIGTPAVLVQRRLALRRPLLGLGGGAEEDQAVRGPGHAALDHDLVLLGVDADHLDVHHRDGLVAV